MYEVPFFKPVISTGLVIDFFSAPVLRFFITYVLICAVRTFTGASKEMIALESETSARTFRGVCGITVAIPTGGLLLKSSIIASRSGPGPPNTSPASRFGVITESKPDLENVFSSK